MKIIRLLRFVVALPICGCLTNYYEQYYVDTVGQMKTAPAPDVQSVELKIATTEEDVLNLIEDGYASIGYSSFYRPVYADVVGRGHGGEARSVIGSFGYQIQADETVHVRHVSAIVFKFIFAWNC